MIPINRFESLKPYELPNSVYNTESKLYVYNTKEKWVPVVKLFKKLYICSGDSFGNKLTTINSLIDNREYIDMDEIVFPDSLAILGKDLVGYLMPFIKSTNLSVYLNDFNVSNEDKIRYLKQVGILLEKMRVKRMHSGITDFYLNDLHENNFIIGEDGRLFAVDIDSCKINGNKVFPSRYLTNNSLASKVSKYERVMDNSCGGFILPSDDTEIYCYIIIILNFLYGGNVNSMSVDEIYLYLNYLEDIGVDLELINMFNNIVVNNKNVNPYPLLDSVIPYIGRSSAYKSLKRQGKI